MNGTTIRRKIFEFVVEHQARWRDLPGVYELRQQFGGLTEDVDLHLEQLEREGLLHLKGDGTIELRPTSWQAPAIEIYNGLPDSCRDQGSDGDIAQGAIFFDLRSVGIETKSDLDGFIVLDNCMADAGIRRGDIAILSHQQYGESAMPDQENRDAIVAVRMDGGLTLRRIVTLHGIPHYLAENALQPDLRPAYEIPSYGTLWGVFRAGLTGRTRSAVSYSAKPSAEVVWPPAQNASAADERNASSRAHQQHRSSAKDGKKAAPQTPKAGGALQFPPPPPQIGLNDPPSNYIAE